MKSSFHWSIFCCYPLIWNYSSNEDYCSATMMMNLMMTMIMLENSSDKSVDCQMLLNVEMWRCRLNDDHEDLFHSFEDPTFVEIVVRTYSLLTHSNHFDRLYEEELEYLWVDSDKLKTNLKRIRSDCDQHQWKFTWNISWMTTFRKRCRWWWNEIHRWFFSRWNVLKWCWIDHHHRGWR